MTSHDQNSMLYSRRDFGKLALAGLPLRLLGAQSSRFNGVQIGSITYRFRSISDPEAIIKAMTQIGLSEAELMSNHAEALAGAPAPPRGGGRGGATPEQVAAQQ